MCNLIIIEHHGQGQIYSVPLIVATVRFLLKVGHFASVLDETNFFARKACF